MHYKQLRGRQSEAAVIKYFVGKGFKLESQRIRYAGVEIDLLFRSPQGCLHIVEVKSCQEFLLAKTIHKNQGLRIWSVLQTLLEQNTRGVRAHLALVDSKNQILVHKDFLGDLGIY